mgnify:CR=1 FL=1
MKLFDPKLFFVKDFTEKEEIQTCLVHAASDLYKLDNLAEEIELREEFWFHLLRQWNRNPSSHASADG